MIFDGREYTQEQMDRIMEQVHKVLYSDVGAWLEEFRGVALEHIEHVPIEEDLPDGWRLLAGATAHSQHYLFGLKIPRFWIFTSDEEAADQMASMVRRLGERMWEVRGNERLRPF
jgi:hypothetical protein